MDREKLKSLAAEAKQGNKNAMNRLLTEFYPQLYYFTFKQVNNEETAADICQDTCVSIISKINSLNDPSAFVTWAYKIATNKAKRYRITSARELQFSEDEDGNTILDTLEEDSSYAIPEQMLEDKAFTEIMQKMINALPTDLSVAMMLYYYDKLPVADIADIQGVSVSTLKSRLRYGREELKVKIEEYEAKHHTKLHSFSALLFFLFSEEAKGTPMIPLVLPTAAEAATAAAVTGGAVSAASGFALQIASAVIALTLIGGTAFGAYVWMGSKSNGQGSESANALDSIYGTAQIKDPDGNTELPPTHSCEQDGHVWMDTEWKCTECGETLKESVNFTFEEVKDQSGEIIGYSLLKNYNSGDGYVPGNGTYYLDLVIPYSYNGKPVIAISKDAFANTTYLNSIAIPKTVKRIEESAFVNCVNMREMILPTEMEYIGPSAFASTQIKSIRIPDGITYVLHETFMLCGQLKTVVLPESLHTIHFNAFSHCSELESIKITENIKKIGRNAFSSCTKLLKTEYGIKYVGNWAVECDKNTEVARLRAGTVGIADNTFEGCTKLTETAFPDTLKTIGDLAFKNCTEISELAIPDSVEAIGSGAFEKCIGIKSLKLPKGLKAISGSLLSECTLLSSIEIPEGVTNIGANAFRGCTSLVSINIPASVTKLGEHTFSLCSALTTVNYAGKVQAFKDAIPIDEKGGWEYNAGNYTVHCADGTIAKYW